MTLALLLMVAILANAQTKTPVRFTTQLKMDKSAIAEIVFSGKIEPKWHVYSTNLPSGGPTSATFTISKIEGAELVGKLTPHGKEISKHDPLFDMQLRYFENNVTFIQKVKFTKPNYKIEGYLEYGACDDQSCMPPTYVEFSQSGASPAVATETKAEKADEKAAKADDKTKKDEVASTEEQTELQADNSTKQQADSLAKTDSVASTSLADSDKDILWRPVIQQLQQFGGNIDLAGVAVLKILFMGLIGVL